MLYFPEAYLQFYAQHAYQNINDMSPKLSLYMPGEHRGKVEVYLHSFLISALDGGERSTSGTFRFTPGERTPAIHYLGGRVGPRANVHSREKKEIPCPDLDSNRTLLSVYLDQPLHIRQFRIQNLGIVFRVERIPPFA